MIFSELQQRQRFAISILFMNNAITGTCFIAAQTVLYESADDKNGLGGCLTLILSNFAIV